MKALAALFFGKEKQFPPSLNADSRSEGRSLFWRFFLLNGISVAFLMENVLIIYAIRNGVPDPLVAVLASFIYMTKPFMIFGKRLIARMGAARTWGLFWFLRYASASFMILAPFLQGRASQTVISAVILISALGFAMFRSVGIVSATPLEGEVTTSENRGTFLSGNFLRVNTSHLLAMGLLIIVIGLIDRIWVYQAVIAVGCLTGMYASTVIVKIPESSAPSESAKRPFKEAFTTLWKQSRARNLLFAWCAGLVSFSLVIPLMMISVKSGYGISDYAALSFSLILLLGGISSSLLNSAIADQVGPRPLLILYTGALMVPAAFWALAPAEFSPVLIAVVFFISGFCKFGIMLCLAHYFLSSIETTDRVGSVLFMRIFSGIAAGLAGSVIGGGLLSLFEHLGAQGLDIYRFSFRFIFAVLIAMTLIVGRLEKLNEWPVRRIFGLLVSPRDMYALFVLKRLRRQQGGATQDTEEVQRLGEIRSMISEETLRDQLTSPMLSVRVNALLALGRISFGRETEDAVLRELERGEFTSAWIAAEILGEKKASRAVPQIRKGLDSQDPYLQGKCMAALVKLQDQDSFARIKKIFENSVNPRIIIHGAQAISLMKDTSELYRLLKKALLPGLPGAVVDEVLTAAAETAGSGVRYYRFLQQYNRDKQYGVSELAAELSDNAAGGESLRYFSESVHEGEPLKYVQKGLKETAEKQSGRIAEAVAAVLQEAGDEPLPPKAVLCMTLILSVSTSDIQDVADTAVN